MKVRDVFQKNSGFVDKVLGSDSIEKVITVMGLNKTTRTVFVVDKSKNLIGIIMTCETCGTIERYGKRVDTGKRLCIDCWKMKDSKKAKNSSDKAGSSDNERS